MTKIDLVYVYSLKLYILAPLKMSEIHIILPL